LKPCRPDIAVDELMSLSNSIKAIPGRASTMRTYAPAAAAAEL
jgi:hypothetical protein